MIVKAVDCKAPVAVAVVVVVAAADYSYSGWVEEVEEEGGWRQMADAA